MRQARALDDIRRESQQDIAQAYRLNYAAERRAATMQARLGVAAADQERAFAAAAQQLEVMRLGTPSPGLPPLHLDVTVRC